MTEKVNIGNPVTMVKILEFDIALPNEQPLTVEQYLSGGSRSVILNSAAFFLCFKNSKSEFSDKRKFLEMFFRKENTDFANQIYDNIRDFEKKGV